MSILVYNNVFYINQYPKYFTGLQRKAIIDIVAMNPAHVSKRVTLKILQNVFIGLGEYYCECEV